MHRCCTISTAELLCPLRVGLTMSPRGTSEGHGSNVAVDGPHCARGYRVIWVSRRGKILIVNLKKNEKKKTIRTSSARTTFSRGPTTCPHKHTLPNLTRPTLNDLRPGSTHNSTRRFFSVCVRAQNPTGLELVLCESSAWPKTMSNHTHKHMGHIINTQEHACT